MKIVWSQNAWTDYLDWQIHDPVIIGRINELIRSAMRTPFVGLGKPEPLKGDLSGWWSRRITSDHRLVYRIRGSKDDQAIEIAQCRFHY
ncbi:Txe/YoeB family addiction module toxin [Aureimonas pseudogalii]|uniref:Putative mRNA interferase YoeB n=1 Tax=Aureimonas pseudogalii TaxID=1744844 RepID=A0A7W6H3U2_9HYPH|nr:Txe/YoeB family addiction module toxin [Aureimonas pseudogalii]MBB3996229.1 toxin YoeB [Aureimonas pseudogalii]